MTPQTTPGFLKYPDTCRASFVSGHSSLAHLLTSAFPQSNKLEPVWLELVWESVLCCLHTCA